MFNHYSIIWIIKIFLQIRIRIRIFLHESWIFGFRFENFLTTNKIRIQKISRLRIRFGIRICSKKRFVTTLQRVSPVTCYVSGEMWGIQLARALSVLYKYTFCTLLSSDRHVQSGTFWGSFIYLLCTTEYTYVCYGYLYFTLLHWLYKYSLITIFMQNYGAFKTTFIILNLEYDQKDIQ